MEPGHSEMVEMSNQNPEVDVETAQFVNSMEHSEILESMSGHLDQNHESNEETRMSNAQQSQNHQPGQSPPARRRYFDQKHVSLHKAALQGNWKIAEEIIKECPGIVNEAITEGGETALHLAAAAGHTYFVEQLKGGMANLHIKNDMKRTPLCFAATTGHVRIAKVMSRGEDGFFRTTERFDPLFFAAWLGHKEMANYLFEKSEFTSWTSEEQSAVLSRSIHAGLYDLAVKIVTINKNLALAIDADKQTPLQILATKPSAFRDTSRGFLCKIASTILCCFKLEACNTSTPCDAYKLLDILWTEVIGQQDIETTQLGERIEELLFTAGESENDYFTIELIKRYPDCIYKTNGLKQSIFHIAILKRSAKVFSLIYELHGMKGIIGCSKDNDKNNILHLAARLPHHNNLNTIPGAALQMQREIMWYKEVEKMVPHSYKTMKSNGKTPHELFLEQHDGLMKEGGKQIKQIAKSCMLVTTLITTIVFTTAFTAPGGYNDKGTPILRNEKPFIILPISQAIATLASLISMLMFLSVLTSRFLENDFLRSLPLWLVVGVVALFLSIVAMMVAFCSCIFFYNLGVAVMVVLLVLFASVPITFLILKGPLLFTILRCTYSSKWIFRSKNQLFS